MGLVGRDGIIRIGRYRFKTDGEAQLNSSGQVIGSMVRLGRERYYLSCRQNKIDASHPERFHYFVLFQGYGIDWALLKDLVMGKHGDVLGIWIFYDGVTEKKLLYADLDTWILESEPYGTTSRKRGVIRTHGEQRILPEKYMKTVWRQGKRPDYIE